MGRKKDKPERDETTKALHYVQISRLYLQGMSQHEIGKEIGLSQQQVSLDLKAIRSIWKQSAAMKFDERLAMEVARIDELERTYYEAWKRSIKERQRSTQQFGQVGDVKKGERPSPANLTVQSEDSLGNVAYLQGVERCIAMRCKLFGLEPAIKVASINANISVPATANAAIAEQLLADPHTEELIRSVRRSLTIES